MLRLSRSSFATLPRLSLSASPSQTKRPTAGDYPLGAGWVGVLAASTGEGTGGGGGEGKPWSLLFLPPSARRRTMAANVRPSEPAASSSERFLPAHLRHSAWPEVRPVPSAPLPSQPASEALHPGASNLLRGLEATGLLMSPASPGVPPAEEAPAPQGNDTTRHRRNQASVPAANDLLIATRGDKVGG